MSDFRRITIPKNFGTFKCSNACEVRRIFNPDSQGHTLDCANAHLPVEAQWTTAERDLVEKKEGV